MRRRSIGKNPDTAERTGMGPKPDWEEPRPARTRWLACAVDLGPLSELFFVSGVVALLLTRFYLALAGFPQLGGTGLHVAHLLWGACSCSWRWCCC